MVPISQPANLLYHCHHHVGGDLVVREVELPESGAHSQECNLRDLYTDSGQSLQGSLTAVPKPNFATKYAVE